MTDITIEIAPVVSGIVPRVAVAAFQAHGVDALDAGTSSAELEAACAALRAADIDVGAIAREPPFASWRAAYAAAGMQPSKFRASVEALARRALSGTVPSTGTPLVDAYNAVSIRMLAPLGAYDADRLPAPAIVLRRARAGDAFSPVGGDAGKFPLTGEPVVYASGSEVLCYGFNHRDSAVTALSAGTRTAFLVGEAVDDDQRGRLARAMEALHRLLASAGARVGPIATADAAAPRATVAAPPAA
ncbi:B3/B4 domain-containing protein [Salinarimonas sp. NSM]|uniref:B3/B4 domain-containing protein n=1 Tax=Salinarimonas sp. NSM TaxID=3458003 RepID=UPI0040350377